MSEQNTWVKQHQNRIRRALPEGTAVLVSMVVFISFWQLIGSYLPARVLPSPFELLVAFEVALGASAEFAVTTHYPITIVRVLIAATLCLVVGMFLGIVMGTSERAEEYLITYLLATFAFPSVIWAFFAVLWMGLTGWFATVFPVFMVVMPYVAINVHEGMTDLDGKLPEMATSFDADRWMLWKYIYIPHLLPHIFANARLCLMLAWKITLIGEIFGTRTGVGVIINNFFQANQNEMIVAWVVPMMLLVFVADRGLSRIERRAFAWRSNQSGALAATA